MIPIYRAENLSTGIPFNVRVIQPGDAYGKNHDQIHEGDDPMVEFFDARYDFHKSEDGKILGQFVSRYYLSTLEGKDGFTSVSPIHDGTGIDLHGGVDEWTVDSDYIRGLSDFLREHGVIGMDPVSSTPEM
jgi:hypothetical protein